MSSGHANAGEDATTRSGYGHAEFYGEVVEEAVCGTPRVRNEPLYHDLYLDRARTYDARRTEDKGKVQIKGCREWTSNGVNARTRGRFRIWWDQLEDCEEFVFVVYDPSQYDPILRYCRMQAHDLRLLLPDREDWYESGHATKRGTDLFMWLSWAKIFGTEDKDA